MPIRNVCLDENDQKKSQRLMRIAFACHIFNGNIFFVTVIIHLFFTIFLTLKIIEEEQKNQPGQDEKDRSRKGRRNKKIEYEKVGIEKKGLAQDEKDRSRKGRVDVTA